MRTHDYSVIIRPKDKSAADEYIHKGKTYIEGRHNSTYVIDLVNHSAHRVEAVVSVDGLAVTDGKPASFHSKGFVVPAYQTISLRGWLLNGEQAAQFVFGDKRDSYSAKSGAQTTTGIIGVAWFPERPVHLTPLVFTHTHATAARDWLTPIPQTMWDPAQTLGNLRVGASTVGSNSVATTATQTSLGTQFGESVTYHTTPTAFERMSAEPQTVSMMYYDHAQNLTRMGIRLKPRSASYSEAFPGNPTPTYCEPPPGWVSKKW